MTRTTLLLTRPHHSAQAFAAGLSEQARARVDVLIAPLMEISGLGVAPDLSGMAAVIFTSVNGVAQAPRGQGRQAFCVGTRTTAAAKAHGWDASQAGDTAAELIETVKQNRPIGPVLHLGGRHTRGQIADRLTLAGIPARHIALYDQKLLPLSPQADVALKRRCIVPVFSPRTAQNLAQLARGALQHAHIVALSKAVAEPFQGENLAELFILPQPHAGYMRKAVENLCLNCSCVERSTDAR